MPTKQQERPSLYPLIDIDLIKNPNRFYAFPLLGGFVKQIMIIPILIELHFLHNVYNSILIINSLAVLFTGRYWRISYDLGMGIQRLMSKTMFFLYGLTNDYPGFSLSQIDFGYKIDYPENPNQAFAFPVLGGLIRAILLVPFTIFTAVVMYAVAIGTVIGSFVVLFVGRYPESVYEIVIDSVRMYQATWAYWAGLSDKYPTFKISMNHKGIKVALLVASCLLILLTLISIIAVPSPSKTITADSYYNTKQIQPLEVDYNSY